MSRISIKADCIAKDFNRSNVFEGISFSIHSPVSLAITGKNGSGKSTLSKIIAGVMSLTRGSLTYSLNGKKIDTDEFKLLTGFVSPYLNFYEEFSALENLQILSRIRNSGRVNIARMEEVLRIVDLWERKYDPVEVYSSGMKQRLKYAFAIIHNPCILILDEPTSNMDEKGIKLAKFIANMQKKKGALIIATNKKNEAAWCDREICLSPLD